MSDTVAVEIVTALWIITKILAIIIPIMLAVAYLTYFERKVIGAIQLRKGPNVVGLFGLLQPFSFSTRLPCL